MNPEIENFIQGKRIALLGVSRSGKKFGNTIYKELKQRGYQVYIVHPEAQEIEGERCYSNMAELEGRVDGAMICVAPKQSAQAVRDVVAAGVTSIWLQQGSDSPEALAAARDLGVTPVTGKCILMYAQPVGSLHGIHRFFARITGQL